MFRSSCFAIGTLFLAGANSALAQAEYVDYGTSATILSGGASFAHHAYQYGIAIGKVTQGVWEADLHYAGGKSHDIPIQQIGFQASVLVARSRERLTPFVGFHLAIDYLSTDQGKISRGFSAVTPAVSLFMVSSNATSFAWVPSVSILIHKYFGSFAPTSTGGFQASLGCRLRFSSGTVIFLEPGIDISNPDGEKTTSYYISAGILPISSS